MRYLIIGDSHIPDRADSLPVEIEEGIDRLQKEGTIDGVFFTGDFTKQSLLRTQLDKWQQAGFLKITRGNMDEDDSLPFFEIHTLSEIGINIGLTHGTQVKPRGDRGAAEQLALQKSVQILIIGHSHAADVFLTPSGTLILNPGSCVGAWSFVASGIPSFILLTLAGSDLNVTLFEKRQVELRPKEDRFVIQGKKILPGR